jgi:hypothetical protein
MVFLATTDTVATADIIMAAIVATADRVPD